MICLRKVRLINWYGFANVTAPIGQFTLIAGKNGNGKSVLLDAIKFALYGDTVFNKSSESKGSRTLSSYTRGLLDATAGTYIRPAEKVANVYTHIVMEFYDAVEDKPFLLGAVIETSAANICQTSRYVMDHTVMEDVEHTYMEGGALKPFTSLDILKRYGVPLMNRDQGLQKFMQMTGLKLNTNQIPTYLRKLRGIMSYDPNAKIDRFIRESVLEEKKVDFEQLIDAKANIDKLTDNFEKIQEEVDELDVILKFYDAWEQARDRLLKDDICIIYKRLQDLDREIREHTSDRDSAQQRKEEIKVELRALDEKNSSVTERLMEAKMSLRDLDVTKSIEEAERHLRTLEGEKQDLADKCSRLDHFQDIVNQCMNWFFQAGETLEDQSILASLCQLQQTAAEKAAAVARFKMKVDGLYDELVQKIGQIQRQTAQVDADLNAQERILEDCRKHKNAYDQIPDYVGLRADIDREFEKRGIQSKARFACEYVISLKDESWRDAIEAFLGPRRYTILVDPEYYDIADDVLNRSSHRYAHLFNTKLLMRKKVQVEEDSVVDMLEIQNSVAQQYFDYQLGRMHAVDISEVRYFENAISKEGRVAVAMDSYFLRLDKIRYYYLGQETFELNEKRAEREIERLQEEKRALLEEQKEMNGQRARVAQNREQFREYDYDAHQKYQSAAKAAEEVSSQLKDLKRAQKKNQEFIELSTLVDRLTAEQKGVQDEQRNKFQEDSEQDGIIQRCQYQIETKSGELEVQQAQYHEHELEHYTVVQEAVAGYIRYLENGQRGTGGILAESTRKDISRNIEQNKSDLMQKQADYIARYAGGDQLPRGTEGRKQYASRKDRIWMDDLQQIREKLDDQTRRYEDIFKKEFVLKILKSCEGAQEDLRQMNRELGKLHFSAKYQFDVHYVKDGSDYSKIIGYARYLDEREHLSGDWMEGQMSLEGTTSVTDEEGEQLEEEMKRIVDRMIDQNSQELIEKFADYRNYMTYEILISNQVLDHAKLSRQTGYNSGAEVQIPYLLILSSALLMIYNQRTNSTRLVFIDEPFAKMDPGNVKLMLAFLREQQLQVIFCSPDKTESIGNECEVLLPVLRPRPDHMLLGIVQFHEDQKPASLLGEPR